MLEAMGKVWHVECFRYDSLRFTAGSDDRMYLIRTCLAVC